MRFARERTLLAIEPLVGFAVTIALAAAGLDYWALVIGFVAGTTAWQSGCVLASPYRLRLSFDRGALRGYFQLLLAAAGGQRQRDW